MQPRPPKTRCSRLDAIGSMANPKGSEAALRSSPRGLAYRRSVVVENSRLGKAFSRLEQLRQANPAAWWSRGIIFKSTGLAFERS